jgi:TPR repeat protein
VNVGKDKLIFVTRGTARRGKPHTLNVILPILFILAGVPMSAQTDGGGGGFSQPATPEAEAQWRQEAQMRFSQAAKIQHSRGRPFRVVDNKIYNVQTSLLWSVISGAVYEKDGDVVIVKASFGSFPYIAVKNYTGEAVESHPVSTLAMPAGIYDMEGSPIELYDCGILPTPEQMQQIRDEQDKALALVEQQKAAAQKAAEAKAYALQASAVRWLQSQAASGSASAQCSLGLHYLAGQGCETNQTLAVFWLQKAAAQGDIEASNKLAQIQIP